MLDRSMVSIWDLQFNKGIQNSFSNNEYQPNFSPIQYQKLMKRNHICLFLPGWLSSGSRTNFQYFGYPVRHGVVVKCTLWKYFWASSYSFVALFKSLKLLCMFKSLKLCQWYSYLGTYIPMDVFIKSFASLRFSSKHVMHSIKIWRAMNP